MPRFLRCLCVALVLVVGGFSQAYAQATASISGVVRDSAGGVVPGVTIVVKDDATGRTNEAVTGADGRYAIPALLAGSYTVTATLAGFKTAEAKDIHVAPGQPVNIPLTLEVGALSETVNVSSSSELINTETATVTATLNSDQLTRMPTPTRNALNAVTFLPGVNTPGANRDSTINGLPEGFLSITLDGVSNNDNFLRNTDSFFASVTPRQDAVEAVAVTLAAGGAPNGGGAGAVTMAFQTRSGGNRFTGSVYEYYRNPKLNSNYFFNQYNNQAKNDVKLNQFGARVGGPITIPGLYDGRDKAFFFFHFEQIRFPNSFTRTRTVYNARVADGWFRYQCSTGTCEVNLLSLAAANGQIATKDPTMAGILADINAATATTGTRTATDPFVRLVRVAEPVLPARVPADRSPRLQPHVEAPAERVVLNHHGDPDTRLPQLGRPALSGFPEPPRLQVHAAARVALDAVGAVEGRHERTEGRAHGVLRRLAVRQAHELRRVGQLAGDLCEPGGLLDRHPWKHDGRDGWRRQRPELADGTHLQHRRNADVAEGQAHDHRRRLAPDLERRFLEPAGGAHDQHWLRYEQRSGELHVQQHEHPWRLEHGSHGRARHVCRADGTRVQHHERGVDRRGVGQIRRARSG